MNHAFDHVVAALGLQYERFGCIRKREVMRGNRFDVDAVLRHKLRVRKETRAEIDDKTY